MSQPEKIYIVHWEGPFAWEKYKEHVESGSHVLYAINGSHHIYGSNVLLYIGKSERDLDERLQEHASWVEEEYDSMTVRIASIGDFTSWEDWEDGERYKKAAPNVIMGVESLLIYSHQPAYNIMNKGGAGASKGFRIFNTGKIGRLLPEVSSLYQLGE